MRAPINVDGSPPGILHVFKRLLGIQIKGCDLAVSGVNTDHADRLIDKVCGKFIPVILGGPDPLDRDDNRTLDPVDFKVLAYRYFIQNQRHVTPHT
jgi:hypothetical protein